MTQLHTSAYRNPTDLPPADAGKVLVVGAGNSGLQIAARARPHPRGPPRGRDPAEDGAAAPAGPRPVLVADQDRGRTRPASSPVAAWFRKRGGDLVIGTTWDDIDAAGIQVHPRLTAADGRTAQFADGTARRRGRAWCGRPGSDPTTPGSTCPACGTATRSSTRRGASAVPGLWFIGLPWQHSRGSALLGFVGDDARWVAEQVASHALLDTPLARA